jgi:hypothetical protein
MSSKMQVSAELHGSDLGSVGVYSEVVTVNTFCPIYFDTAQVTVFLGPTLELSSDDEEPRVETKVVPLTTGNIRPGMAVAFSA